jgi:hypothetical protein
MHQVLYIYKWRLVKIHTVSSSVGTEGTLAPARAAYVAGIVLACCSLCGCNDGFDRRLSCFNHSPDRQIAGRSCQWESNIDSRHPRGRRGSPLGISS